MNPKLKKSLGPLLGVVLFLAAVWTLHRELGAYHIKDIIGAFREINPLQIFTAIALTLFSYGIMTGYDLLALKFIRRVLPFRKTALASFIGYAFSNNIGFSMIAGASVRYRLYSVWGLSSVEITKIVFVCTLTLWIGFFTLGGIVFSVDPMVLPQIFHLPFTTTRPIGILLLAIMAAYFIFSMTCKQPLKLRNWEFSLPSTRIFGFQVLIAVTDWLLAGSVLYVLLPQSSGLSFALCIGVYLLAQLAGLISQVPGGLGIFETVILLLLSSILTADQIIVSLLAYRLIYYLLPIALAAVFLGVHELLLKKQPMQQMAQAFGQWAAAILPPVLSFTTFIAGAILLFSGATPAVDRRLLWLKYYMPLPLLETSHFIGSTIGMALLLLSRGLQRRLDGAYWLTVILLIIGIFASVFKGFDFEEAAILFAVLIALLPSHRYFYRRASLLTQRFTAPWIGVIMIVAACFIWLGMFSYKYVEYSDTLWWQFTFSGHAPRFLRASAGAAGVLFFFAVARLLGPATLKPAGPSVTDLETVSAIVNKSSTPESNLALLGDKSFLFNEDRTAFIMYAVEGRSWVSMGDPVGPQSEWSELIWRFRELSDRYAGWTLFYQVGPENLSYYLELGLTLTKLGEAARVPLADFSLEGSARKGLRYNQRKLEKEGCRFEILSKDSFSDVLPIFKEISDAWLAEKNTREKRFSLGAFEPDYLKQFAFAVVKKTDQIVAFANIWQTAEKEEISIDLMRYHPETASDGVMDYLFTQLMLWGKQQGYRWFDLGMAPLAGMESHDLAPLWNRLASFVARHGEHFYNFQGLRRYKDKFEPVWQPKYLASPGGLALPQIMANLAAVISGGLQGAIIK